MTSQQRPPSEIRIPILERRLAPFLLGPHDTEKLERLEHPLDNFATKVVHDLPTESNCGVSFLQKELEELGEDAPSSQISGPLPTSTMQSSTYRPFNDKPIQRPHSPTPMVQSPIFERRLARMDRFLEASQAKVLDDTIMPSFAAQSVQDKVTKRDDEIAYQREEEHAGIVHTNESSEFQPFWQKSHTPSSGPQSPIFKRRAALNDPSSQSQSANTLFHYVHDGIAESDYEMQQEDRLYETVQSHESSEYRFFKVLPTPLSDATLPSNSMLSPHSTGEIRIPGFEGEITSSSGDPSSFLHPSAIRPVQDMATAGDNNYVITDPSKEELPEDVRRNQQTILLDPMVNASDFVKKLFNSLEDPNLQSVMCWGPLGDRFSIVDVKEYTHTILPRLYNHSNFASFVRQLNKYGFHKVKNTDGDEIGVQTWCFQHPRFHARKPEELEQIRPKRTVTQRNSQLQNDAGQGSSSGPFQNESNLSTSKRRSSFSSRDSGGPYFQSSRSSPNSTSTGYVHKVTEGRLRPSSPSRMGMYSEIKDLRRESDDAKVRLRSLDRTSESLRTKIEDAQMLLIENKGVLQKMMAYCDMMPPPPPDNTYKAASPGPGVSAFLSKTKGFASDD